MYALQNGGSVLMTDLFLFLFNWDNNKTSNHGAEGKAHKYSNIKSVTICSDRVIYLGKNKQNDLILG